MTRSPIELFWTAKKKNKSRGEGGLVYNLLILADLISGLPPPLDGMMAQERMSKFG